MVRWTFGTVKHHDSCWYIMMIHEHILLAAGRDWDVAWRGYLLLNDAWDSYIQGLYRLRLSFDPTVYEACVQNQNQIYMYKPFDIMCIYVYYVCLVFTAPTHTNEYADVTTEVTPCQCITSRHETMPYERVASSVRAAKPCVNGKIYQL